MFNKSVFSILYLMKFILSIRWLSYDIYYTHAANSWYLHLRINVGEYYFYLPLGLWSSKTRFDSLEGETYKKRRQKNNFVEPNIEYSCHEVRVTNLSLCSYKKMNTLNAILREAIYIWSIYCNILSIYIDLTSSFIKINGQTNDAHHISFNFTSARVF